MSAQSSALLEAFWSWVGGLLALGLLGVTLPFVLGLLVGMVPLAIVRRDWRPLVVTAVGAPCTILGGLWSLTNVHDGAPGNDFWIALSVQLGCLVFGASAACFLRLAVRRIREYKIATRLVASPPDPDIANSQGEFPAPGSRKRLSGIEAEYYIAEWMRHLGAVDAIVTPARADGGIDIRSRFYVAQVKHRPSEFVEVEAVRALIGAAALEHRTPLFFASGHYSKHVYDAAARGEVALFIFQPFEGRLVAANAIAHRLRQGRLRTPVSATT